MIEQLCSPEFDSWKVLAILLFEAWLGKTNKTKSGSILELIFNMVFWTKKEGTMETQAVATTEAKGIVTDKEVAKDLHLDIKVIGGGKLRVELTYAKDGAIVDGGIFLNISAEKLGGLIVDEIEKLIPGDQTGLAAGLKETLAKQLAAKVG